MSHRFQTLDTPLKGLKVIQRKPISDNRGYLERLYCEEEFQATICGSKGIAQINHTMTARRGTVRGLHFQYPPHAESKFVSCLRGEVFDVAVDLRQGSPTLLQWHAEVLSPTNHKTLLIPEGFAHGFQTLTQDCEMLYFHTAHYNPEAEGALNATDPYLNIEWPLEITEMSERDRNYSMINQNYAGIEL